ncbi:MFS transporter [Paenibacillus agilis]|uniref:MFS transporter n=1 Tax=Paenibacillus agilis TaxID=3020863 RepID=A0A559IKE0_9BACL|nr:MFS transporter [Paenibacillus agilis]TVX88132.1 MFS transporter [Paenibacillus agilis]
MPFRVYILAIAAFVVGTVELIVGGILELIAADLNVSVSAAGHFITVFSIAFAVSAPILMNVTAKMDRKKLYVISLFVFMIANLIVAMSSSYNVILAARALSAMSGSIIIVLSIMMASQLVPPSHKARAIGTIFMGISGSLVLGVPLGMVLGNAYGWRAPFFFIALLSAIAMICIQLLMEKTAPNPIIPLRKQLASLKDSKIVSGQLISFLLLTGHLTLYAYFAPYVQSNFNISASTMSIIYFLFGIAAVSGGGIGGWISDRLGTRKALLFIVPSFALSMFVLPLAAQVSFYIFMAVVMVWSALSWAISPAQQTYLMQSAPETADIQLSLNTSIMHLGIACGSFIGGIAIKEASVAINPWIGGAIAMLGLASALFSLSRRSRADKQPLATTKLAAEV